MSECVCVFFLVLVFVPGAVCCNMAVGAQTQITSFSNLDLITWNNVLKVIKTRIMGFTGR